MGIMLQLQDGCKFVIVMIKRHIVQPPQEIPAQKRRKLEHKCDLPHDIMMVIFRMRHEMMCLRQYIIKAGASMDMALCY
jgi:hypothetical protein